MRFTADMKIGDIVSHPLFKQMEGQFVSKPEGDWFLETGESRYEISLKDLQKECIGWDPGDLLKGFERLADIAEKREQYVYGLESGAKLIYMPADEKKTETVGIMCAGGGYTCVCTFIEAMPVAARLNELGMDCFLLNYRTGSCGLYPDGLMPRPLDDIALAWRFIKDHQDEFGVDAESYIIAGYSAGGHAVGMWGTKEFGSRRYGIPVPRLLMPVYPFIGFDNRPFDRIKRSAENMFGKGYDESLLDRFTVSHQIDEGYPRTYIAHAVDDPAVTIQDSIDLAAALQEKGVPYVFEKAPFGGHGFGLGTGSGAEGWVDRALEFMEKQI